MSGFLLLRDNPYMAKSDRNGNFLIKNLPAGEFSFQFWHEKSGYLRQVKYTLRGQEFATTKFGRAVLRIEQDDNSLGELKLSPSRVKVD